MRRIESFGTVACLAATVSAFAAGPCGPMGCPAPPSTPAITPVERPSEAVRASLAGVARIVHQDKSGTSLGSGALVANLGGQSFFLTCAHLFEAPGQTRVRIARRSLEASVVAFDRRNDLALLRTAACGVRPVPLATGTPDGLLTACGFGGSGELRCVTGPITGRSRAVGAEAPSLRIRGAVRSGDSGGPVLDAAGRLVAVVWGQRDGETYATTDGPLRRILARIPRREEPPRVNEPATPSEDTAWRRRVERRLDQIASDRPAALPDDLVRRDDLRSLAEGWDRRLDRLTSQIGIDLSAPPSASTTGELMSGLPTLLTAVAVGGPLGAGLWAASRWASRRRSRRVKQPIAVDSPPPPQQTVPETHYVSYERDEFAKAHQWACEQMARKFPGSVEMLTSLDSLIKQQLNGN